MKARQLTSNQQAVLAAVRRTCSAGPGVWYRATSSGERVTLASLYRGWGLLDRRAWRGVEGSPDAAHEYRPRIGRGRTS